MKKLMMAVMTGLLAVACAGVSQAADSNPANDADSLTVKITPNVDYGVDVDTRVLSPNATLSTQWNASLLDGVTTIHGSFADGTPMTAIPHYARMNHGGNRSIVWIRDQ